MKYAVVFLCLGAACAVYAIAIGSPLPALLLFSSAVAFSGVGLAYAINRPGLFGKRSDGRLSVVNYLLFWPYFLLNHLLLTSYRFLSREHLFDHIEDNVYLGCRLSHRDRRLIEQLHLVSVLDASCEFEEVCALRSLAYYCIPILDTQAPSLTALTAGAEWIVQQSQDGSVYVHCALGHGRSATFTAAYLLLSGKAHSVQEAILLITAKRPAVKLHPSQIARLEQFAAELTPRNL